MEILQRIYSQSKDIVLETIGKIVREGDRLAAIHLGGNAIAENAKDIRFNFGVYQFAGPASYDNVDVNYVARKPIIEVQDGQVHVNTHPNPVEYEYIRGKLDIYMRQYNKVEFTPPPTVEQWI